MSPDDTTVFRSSLSASCSSALIVTVAACVVMFQLHVVQLAPTGCEGNPCGAHGVCVPDKEQHSCACKDGWTGDSCSVQTGCDTGVNCGQGRCVPHNGQHTCECDVGWCGPTCSGACAARTDRAPHLALHQDPPARCTFVGTTIVIQVMMSPLPCIREWCIITTFYLVCPQSLTT